MSTIERVREWDASAAGKVADSQIRSLALAGTVPVPSPFPAPGRIDVSTYGIGREEVDELDDPTGFEAHRFFRKVFVEVAHEVNPRLTITRVVKLCDIAAVFVPEDPRNVTPLDGQWYLGAELEALVLARLKEVRSPALPPLVPILHEAIVYLPEAAKILLRVESGMTAAESVEYYPPTPGERSHEFRRGFCDG